MIKQLESLLKKNPEILLYFTDDKATELKLITKIHKLKSNIKNTLTNSLPKIPVENSKIIKSAIVRLILEIEA